MTYFPFLKWAGGKRWLSAYTHELLPEEYNHYFEPFMGGAAMFGAIQPSAATLADVNAELVNCYKQVADKPTVILGGLMQLQTLHSEETYYRIRSENPIDDVERAIRFLYLNRACFNGIYRVNQSGQFNVPKGTKETILFPYDDFPAASALLKSAEIVISDFEPVIDIAKSGDFVFCDPPYTVAHNNNGFVRYNERMFSWEDQVRLKDTLIRASSRGVLILLTNAAHSSIKDLYAGTEFDCRAVSRQSVIGGGRGYRGEYGEFLISNYALPLFNESAASMRTPSVQAGIH